MSERAAIALFVALVVGFILLVEIGAAEQRRGYLRCLETKSTLQCLSSGASPR